MATTHGKHVETSRDMIVPNGAHPSTVVAAHAKFAAASTEERQEIVRTGFKPGAHAKRLREFVEWLEKIEAGNYRRPDLATMDLLESLYGRVGIMASDAAEAFGLRGEVEAYWAQVDAADTREGAQGEVQPGKAAPPVAGQQG